jgi:endonuclease III
MPKTTSAKPNTYPITAVLDCLNEEYPSHPMGELTEGNPFRVLIACIMSLRTKDDMTIPLARELFKVADSPEAIVALGEAELAKRIYPVGFYKTKAKDLIAMCQRLVEEFDSEVPDEIETLLTFRGVGRKTANLVVGLGHGKPAVCVDIHVFRICNRLGYLTAKDPEDTEMQIRQTLPQPYWHVINRVMVRHGQDCCKPIKPLCSQCPVAFQCQKNGVIKAG